MHRPLLIAALSLVAAPAFAAPPAPRWTGVWRNASNTVQLRAAPCSKARDAGMCGTVISASAKAKSDVAARGGTLVGTRLFSDFRQTDDNLWEGDVYVPDIDRSFSGTIAMDGPNRLVGEGCLFGRLGCKQQVWTRVSARK